MKRIIRTTGVLVASGVVAVALLAACGGGDPGEARTVAPESGDAPAARLAAQAERYERSAHLQGQAGTYGAPAGRQDAGRPGPLEAGNRVVAEQLERSAKFEGQARTYSNAHSSDNAPAPADDTSGDGFVPGSRHMPTR
jgi:hypothetical protein